MITGNEKTIFWVCPCGYKATKEEYAAFDDDMGCPKCRRSLKYGYVLAVGGVIQKG